MTKSRIRFVFAWYDFWAGFFWNRRDKVLFILPIPMVGIAIDFGPREKGH